MLTASTAGFLTVPLDGSQPLLPHLTKNYGSSTAAVFFCVRSVRETWILLPTEPLPAAGSHACLASAGQADCKGANLDRTCALDEKHQSVKPIICWTGEREHLQRSFCRQEGLSGSLGVQQTCSQQCGSCSCVLQFFFSCRFTAEGLVYRTLLK